MSARRGPRVRLRRVWVAYGPPWRARWALRGASWTAGPGRITALLGANGSGKTTTFRLLLGLGVPRSGSVSVDGEPPDRRRIRRGMGFLPADRISLPGWTVAGLLQAGCDGTGRDPEAVLDTSGIAPLRSRRVDALSRGEARLALLAYVLAPEPEMVLLDEPWSGLDARARGLLAGRLGELRAAGRTVVVSSHELLETARIADRFVILTGGRVALEADADELPPETLQRILHEEAP